MIAICLFAMLTAGTGLRAQEVTITLISGWTWISYPSTDTLDFATALGDFTPMQGDVIKSQWGSATYRSTGRWVGTISQFYPGSGYHYKSNRTEPVQVTIGTPLQQAAVTTDTPTNVTYSSATCGGTVTNAGNATVIARGVCWSPQHNPTIANPHTTNGEGAGSFSSSVSGLTINTVYYLRAYAVTESGVTYGNEVSFTTQLHLVTVSANPNYGGTVDGGGIYQHGQSCTVTAIASNGYSFASWTKDGTMVSTNASYTFTVNSNQTLVANFVPMGAINGLFSVSGSMQVYFSRGNLQYKASTNTWRFAPYQYSYIGSDNANMSSTYSGWIDLFGWGTSGYNHGAVCYQPWSTSNNNNDYYAYGSVTYNLNDQTGRADWGYNAISNGGNQTNQWRTLTSEEWEYVFFTRSTTSGKRFAKAIVNGVNGLILLPDDWSTSYYSLNSTNSVSASFSSNVITSSQWSNSLQKHGAVFLPVAGYRSLTTCYDDWGSYWTATQSNDATAYTFDFHDVTLIVREYLRSEGESVRLVRNAQSSTPAHSYVDLGLPSGTLWATCNVGADIPEGYGSYFAWGETQTKDTYNWSTYQYCMGSENTLTKYCSNATYGYNGFTDNLTVLQLGDDAATAQWGSGWRIPTKEEWEELYQNTSQTWTTQNGVIGRLLRASNGNTLFLPAAGGYDGSGLVAVGSVGSYWSSSLRTDNPNISWRLLFDQANFTLSFGAYRYLGGPVRAVRSSAKD